MNTSLMPKLNGYEKGQLSIFLSTALIHDKFIAGRYPLPTNRISLYMDDACYQLRLGAWTQAGSQIYLGDDGGPLEIPKRLAVLLTLTQLCTPSERLTQLASQAIGRYLLGEFNDLNGSLVVSSEPSTGLAFNADGRVASLFGEEWMTPSGEVVDVKEAGWVVCATVGEALVTSPPLAIGQLVRITEVPGIGQVRGQDAEETITGLNRNGATVTVRTLSGRSWAVNTSDITVISAAVTAPSVIAIGSRVRWTPGEEELAGFVIAEGSVARSNGDQRWIITLDTEQNGLTEIYTSSEQLELLGAVQVEFTVGQMVRYSRIPLATEAPGVGTFVRYHDDDSGRADIEAGGYGRVYVDVSDLTAA